MMVVQPVPASEAYPAIIGVHYAHRIPSISFAFGLFSDGVPRGYVTYGTPSSAPLRDGVAGHENAHLVIELNRLVIYGREKNAASALVGRSLRMLPRPSIVVSYADTAQGHVGYVYQARNFLYTGLSAKRTDWKLSGRESLHGQSVADMSRSAAGGPRGSRAAFMREKFGDDFYLEDRARKHRYVFIVGSARQRSRLRRELLYATHPYPKGDSRRYVAAEPDYVQPLLFSGRTA